jgi:SPP1 gp7 family putative phage head morphogenesis protein
MAGPTNASIQDTLIGNQVDLLKLEGTVRTDVLKVLKELETDIVKRLQAIDPTGPTLTVYQQTRLEKLLKQVQKTTGSSFAKARRVTDNTLLQLAALESGLVSGAYDVALGTSLGVPTLNRQILQELVKDGLIQGAPSSEWWAKQAVGTLDNFRREMRLGVLGGESTGKLATRVRKVMDVTRRQAEALARTSVQSISNLARLRTYQENAHLLKGIQWISTLDSRTTDICKGLDGLLWDTNFNPIGHDTTFPGPTAHWNCRSTQVPVTKSWDELRKSTSPKAKAFAKKADKAGSGARSSLDGAIPATINYEDWLLLKEKAEPGFALNSGALTPGKYALWKQGKLNFKDLVDQSGNPITIAQLQERLKDIIPSTVLPQAALEAQQTAVAGSAAFDSKGPSVGQTNTVAADSLEIEVYDDKIVDQWAKRIKAGEDVTPVFVNQKKLDHIVDGNHRAAAYQKLGQDVPVIYVDRIPTLEALAKPGATPASVFKQIQVKTPSAASATEVMEARVEAVKKAAAINAKKDAQATFKTYANKGAAPSSYHFNALKSLTKQKGGKYIDAQLKADPIALVKQIDKMASTKKLSVDLAHYKQAVTKGKKPSPAAQAAFETLPDVAQKDVLDSVKIKIAELEAVAAAEKVAAEKAAQVAVANEAAAKEIAETLLNPKGKTLLAKALEDMANDPALKGLSPARLLAAAKDKAVAAQAAASKAATLSGYKKKVLSKEKPTPKQAQEVVALSPEETVTLGAQIDTLEAGLEGYKKAVVGGISPTKGQTKAANFLTPKGKKALAKELEGLKAVAPPTAPEVKVAAQKLADTDASPDLDMDKWTYSRPKPGGSVPGAIYKDETGQEWLVKYVSSDDASRNEVLTAKLYNLVGVNTPDVRPVRLSGVTDRPGGLGVASRWIEGIEEAKSGAKQKALDGTYDGFAADAWLANWDVAGLNYDNIVKGPTGKALRIDVGGGLRYRAQGGAKGANFTKTVGEIDSLRDPSMNRQTATTFKAIPEAKIEAGVAQVLRVTDEQLEDLVARFGPDLKGEKKEMLIILKARRNDLKKRYPHLLKAKPAPEVRRVGDVVSDADFDRIKNANASGYAIRADIDEIEDQQILIHHESREGAAGAGLRAGRQTVAVMKLRGNGISKMQKVVDVNASTVVALDTTDLDNKLLTSIRGVGFRLGQGNALDPKDYDRINVAIAALDNTREHLKRLVAKGTYSQKALDTFDNHYDPWVSAINNALDTSKWSPPTGPFGAVELPRPKKTGVTSEQVSWSRGPFAFGQGEFSRGEVVKGASAAPKLNKLEGESRPWVATLDDGTKVRFWGKDAPAALRGRFEVTTRGDDVLAANRAAGVADELAQVNTALPTALDEEELYLIQIGFASYPRTFETLVKQMATGKDQAERIAKAKAYLNKRVGRDITLLPEYNPAGIREAGEMGRVFRFRADLLADPEWNRFAKDYRIHHTLYAGGGDMVDKINDILASGGRMAPTTEKLRLGIVVQGMSPTRDINTGGADYFFTRIQSKNTAYRHAGLVWKAKVAARVDAISYNSDNYGRTDTQAFILNNRKSTVGELRTASQSSGNETNFKGGLSLFEDLDAIVVDTFAQKKRLITLMKSNHGMLRWPDGRELNEVIRVAE